MKYCSLFMLFLFLLVLHVRCDIKQATKMEVSIEFIINSSVKWTKEAYLIIERNNNESSFIYCDRDSMDSYYLEKVVKKNGDSFIVMDDNICLKTAEKEYLLGEELFTVERYRFDIAKTEDEERDIFFNRQLGVLVSNSIHWNTWMTFSRDSVSRSLIDKIIIDETFFIRLHPHSLGYVN